MSHAMTAPSGGRAQCGEGEGEAVDDRGTPRQAKPTGAMGIGWNGERSAASCCLPSSHAHAPRASTH